MKQLTMSALFILVTVLTTKAQTTDLSTQIIGRWLFAYTKPYELIVDTNCTSCTDSIEADIVGYKQWMDGQILEYAADHTLTIILNDTVDVGTYTFDGNVETYVFDDNSFFDVVTIVGDTLFFDKDETEYYQEKVNELYTTDSNNYLIDKVITRYVYTREHDWEECSLIRY